MGGFGIGERIMTINTEKHCEVNIPNRDTVLVDPFTLPQNFKDQTGKWHYNFWDDARYSEADRLLLGVYRYVLNDLGPTDQYQDRTLSSYTITANTVEQDAIYTDWDIDRVKEAKRNELNAQIPRYAGWEISANADNDLEVKDKVQWNKERLIVLSEITDLQTAKGFDTTLPDPLTLENSYVGARQAIQGEKIFNEDFVRVDSGGSSLITPEVQAWQNNNYAAKDDPANGIAVTDAPSLIRQQVNQLNEYRSLVEIERTEWVAPDPWPGHGIIATIRRDDARQILFLWYDENGQYQYWKQFQEIQDGIWQVETDVGQRWAQPETFNFTLNYTTATEFTNQILVPASVTHVVHDVRYNR